MRTVKTASGSDCGADRALLAPWIAGHRARRRTTRWNWKCWRRPHGSAWSQDIIVFIFGSEESLVMKLDDGAVPRIADALASIPCRPSGDPQW